jgi:hypothetical protein
MRVHDGQIAVLLAIGVDAFRWFVRYVIPVSHKLQISSFLDDAQIDGFSWVVCPARGR